MSLKNRGSSLLFVMILVSVVSIIFLSLEESIILSKNRTVALDSSFSSDSIARSAVATVSASLFSLCSNNPSYVICKKTVNNNNILLFGGSNFLSVIPLISYQSNTFSEPLSMESVSDTLSSLFQEYSNQIIDLNDPSLLIDSTIQYSDCNKNLIDASGRYPAFWINLEDSLGHLIGRYAFTLTDESSALNPSIHLGYPRNNPEDWDIGAKNIGFDSTMVSGVKLDELAHSSYFPTKKTYIEAFLNRNQYWQLQNLFTDKLCFVSDKIPFNLRDAGHDKYDLNDLATNYIYGKTPYARACNIASIIDKNFPLFKTRDVSLQLSKQDSFLYLERLACSIVSYISDKYETVSAQSGEVATRDFSPYVTKIAEKIKRLSLNKNQLTVSTQFYVEIWNPYNKSLTAGSIAQINIGNRPYIHFGNSTNIPFNEYIHQSLPLPSIRPNEFIVIPFPPELQTWQLSSDTTNIPYWEAGPKGNQDQSTEENFSFYWNNQLVDYSRRPGLSPGNVSGGLEHFGQKLDDNHTKWQINTLPTWSNHNQFHETNYRFVGDPRATFLTAYKWPVMTNYFIPWKGIMTNMNEIYMINPKITWQYRDAPPINPVTGNIPTSLNQEPEEILSPYQLNNESSIAPYVIRKSSMLSISELGHIFDPAQVDDQQEAIQTGVPSSYFGSGGGRTLRIAEPEYHTINPKTNWDTIGKRAIDLLDIFTIYHASDRFYGNDKKNNQFLGKININTASHTILKSLFKGITINSDEHFKYCTISEEKCDELASIIEATRPYSRLSELNIIARVLANAETYTPHLGVNRSNNISNVFKRAREEGFGKFIGHVTVRTQTFKITVVAESLSSSGRTKNKTIIQANIILTPNDQGILIPRIEDMEWY